jgi:hypothetical protein
VWESTLGQLPQYTFVLPRSPMTWLRGNIGIERKFDRANQKLLKAIHLPSIAPHDICFIRPTSMQTPIMINRLILENQNPIFYILSLSDPLKWLCISYVAVQGLGGLEILASRLVKRKLSEVSENISRQKLHSPDIKFSRERFKTIKPADYQSYICLIG